MAQVPSGTRFIGIATTADLVERKSAVLNKQTEPYTIEDIASSVTTASQGPQGVPGIQGIQGIPGTAGAVGPAGLTWRSIWVSGTSYVANDAVSYDGASWFCILATSGTTNPSTDTTHWALLASQGAQGIQGIQGIPGQQGIQGIQGSPAAQTLQETVDLGNTINDGSYITTISSTEISNQKISGATTSTFSYEGLAFSKNGFISRLYPADTLTGNYLVRLPNASGTIALTSDMTTPTLQQVITAGNSYTLAGYKTTISTGVVSVETVGGNKISLYDNSIQFKSVPAGPYIELSLPITPLTGSRSVYLPDADGTVALTSDITLQKAVTGGNNFVSGFSKITLTGIVTVENTSLLSKSTLEHNKLSFTSNNSGLKTTNLRQSLTPTVNRTITLPDADGTVALKNYKSYVALITQSGTSAPTATVVFNDTAATFTWSYDDVGSYFVTCSSPILLSGKTVVFVTTQGNPGNSQNKIFGGTRSNDSTVSLFTSTNGILDLNLEIRVYN